MEKQYFIWRQPALVTLLALVAWSGITLQAQPRAALQTNYTIVEIQRTVELARAGAQRFDPAQLKSPLFVGDRVRTGPDSGVAIRRSDDSVYRFDEKTEFQILPPKSTASVSPTVRLFSGILYFLHRGKPGSLDVETRWATAAVRGTEFDLRVDDSGTTTVTMIDGVVDLSNEIDTIRIESGQQGVAERGKPPYRRAAIEARNVIQWTLYYPGILDVDEIPLSDAERGALGESLNAYRAGDLLNAVDRYPADRTPASDAERIYRAGLLLSVGQVDGANELLSRFATNTSGEPSVNARLANALEQVIAAVKLIASEPKFAPELASEWLAESYRLQSRADLEGALRAAQSAVKKSPNFGFGWARVAELEFSFGRIDAAFQAAAKALELSPRNAQAVALNGFLFATRNKMDSAIRAFDDAIAIDGRLANAWLGRGLCLIRTGHSEAGREDLMTAAALEPQRAFLRSYLGKAWADAGKKTLAEHELELAESFDPRDPTAWLYSALLKQQYSRINEAIRDLEHAQDLSTNRAIYRSEFMLDQDRAVRSVNLARLYADADMPDVAVREAGRAVALDYANYSAHLFLANSYEAERRANLFNPRLEGPSNNEYLLANLLGPANGRLLAQPVTQLEYGGLFEQNRVGVIANTEYFSRGAWRHSGAQYGTYNGMSYSLEAEYRSDPGELVNQDYVVRQLEGKFKYDLSPSDSVFIRIGDYDSSGGDLRNVSSEADVAQQFRFHVERRPFILTGYHHEWSPSSHTLIMAGYLDATLTGDIPSSGVFALNRLLMRPPSLDGVFQVNVHHTNENRFKSYTIEAQQLVQNGRNSLIAGVGGTWNQENIFDSVSLSDFSQLYWFYLGPGNPVTQQRTSLSYAAASTYAYDYFRLTDSLELAGGLNFTHQESPSNPNTAPVSISRDTKDHVGPKAALIWSPTEAQSFRVAYTQSLSPVTGAGDIVRLEPSHVAGLVQSFREVAPFSIVGPLDAAEIETAEALWEGRFGNTFIAVGGQHLSSRLDRHAGLFLSGQNLGDPPSFGLIEEDIRFREEAAQLSVHQLLSREWSFGAQYRGSYAKLERTYPEYKGRMIGVVDDQSEWRGWLHTLKLTWLYRNRSGVFARSDATFFLQEHERDAASLPEQRFWQVNAFGGYRFARQRAEVTVGVLNLMDKDNHLDPVNYFNDLPRARTFYARLLLDF